jgi:quinol-cytochrome oxidoreductase complex cytochrome b subunit
VVVHLLTLHQHGSGNPLGISGNLDRLAFHPYFVFKDLVTVVFFILTLSIFIFYYPNVLGHSDNYIPANPMQTPPSIVPEWYNRCHSSSLGRGKDSSLINFAICWKLLKP